MHPPRESTSTRPPAVAGRFYPIDADELRLQVRGFIDAAKASPATTLATPRAIIGPHAGYMYSGPIAGSAYGAIASLRDRIDRVIVLSPAHTLAFAGIAVPTHNAFATPLGNVKLDRDSTAQAATLPFVSINDQAHSREHGIEVHLPFLQVTLGSFKLIPIVIGESSGEEVAALLELLWRDERTLVVVSSDLSHYYEYDVARDMDSATARAIEKLEPHAISSEQACGQNAIQGLLLEASRRHLQLTTLDLRNSGDTAGSRDQVVGYGAWVAAEKNSNA